MIYLTYWDQSLFALYNGVLIRIPDSNREIRAFLTDVLTNASALTRDERRLAHHLPKCRVLNWTLKIRYTDCNWNAIEQFGTIINR